MTEARGRGGASTLAAAFLHFSTSCMAWVLLGALGIYIAAESDLSPRVMGLVVAVPILSGSLLRIPLGRLGDRVGARRLGAWMLAGLAIPVLVALVGGRSLPGLLAIGAMLGIAGASFAVALPLASRWYPAERQGLVLGLVAAGNTGTVLTYFLAPRLAERMGWHAAAALLLVPLAITLVLFLALAREAPKPAAHSRERVATSILRQPDLWIMGALYAVTFGGYVGMGASLPLLIRDQYATGAVGAGSIAALAGLVGGLTRPLGGYLADRLGGARVLAALLLALGAAYHFAARLPSLGTLAVLLCAAMLCMGLGNGAVFQLVPRRFPREIGAATGWVGAIGGVGGCLLPLLLGFVRELRGSVAPALAMLGVGAFGAAALVTILLAMHEGWRTTWRVVVPGPDRQPELRPSGVDLG